MLQRSLAGLFCLALAALASGGAGADELDFAFQPAIQRPDPTSVPLMDITRVGARLVVAGAGGLIALSDDNGDSWQQAATPVSTTLTAVSFADDKHGWATGHGGVILHSRDGGETWELQFDGNQANRQFLAYSRRRVGELEQAVAAAEDSAIKDELGFALEDAQFAVEDAQTAIETGPVDPFLDILMLDTQRGFAVGAYGMLYITENGGEQWQLTIGGIDNPYRYHYYGIAIGANGTLYLAGEAGLLYHSVDGGKQWQRHEDVYDGSLFGAITTDGRALVFGLRGHMFASEDGGESWNTVTTDTESGLYGGIALDGQGILITGAGGQLLLSENGGRSFEARNHASRASFAGGLADGEGGLLVVGMDGLVRINREHAGDE